MKSSTFSSRWNTSCTPTHGDCGCDNCKGNFKDISSRMEKFKVRRDLLMRSRSMQIWGVPQAFKDESYWERPPTGVEFLLSCSLYVLEGAVGLVGWIENSDMSEELKQATKVFGIALEKMIGYLTLPDNYLIHQSVNSHNRNIMVRYWKDSSNSSILLISTNMVENSQAWSIDLSSEFLDDVDSKRSVSFRIEVVEKIFESNVLQSLEIKKGDTLIGSGNFDGLGCGAYILKFSN
ncbi:hypothetical protein BY996DRAFT_7144880 [Phakopsora pachyrhizi]|nr:hypothetical protein BY996DRAFT_7144880 [Phakopsora pachyrhizi]